MFKQLLKIHIGNEIKQIAEQKGICAIELGKRINRNRTNVYDIFKRNAIDTQLLIMISQALEYNFFEHYVIRQPVKTTNTRLIFEIDISTDELAGIHFPEDICKRCSVRQNQIGVKMKERE